jgi:hypothetical protein
VEVLSKEASGVVDGAGTNSQRSCSLTKAEWEDCVHYMQYFTSRKFDAGDECLRKVWVRVGEWKTFSNTPSVQWNGRIFLSNFDKKEK